MPTLASATPRWLFGFGGGDGGGDDADAGGTSELLMEVVEAVAVGVHYRVQSASEEAYPKIEPEA